MFLDNEIARIDNWKVDRCARGMMEMFETGIPDIKANVINVF